jgi:hypothetical protein
MNYLLLRDMAVLSSRRLAQPRFDRPLQGRVAASRRRSSCIAVLLTSSLILGHELYNRSLVGFRSRLQPLGLSSVACTSAFHRSDSFGRNLNLGRTVRRIV